MEGLIGGTISDATGGKFANGAVQWAYNAESVSAPTSENGSRPLTASEIVFLEGNGQSIFDIDKVRVHNGGLAGADSEVVAPNGDVYVGTNNTSGMVWSEDYTLADKHSRSQFLHEMVHIFQNRNLGCSMFCMGFQRLKNSSYIYKIDPNKKWSDFGLEQRAEMVQDRWRLHHGMSTHFRGNRNTTVQQLDAFIPFNAQ